LTSFDAIGLPILRAGLTILAVGLVFYGAGIGLENITRETRPLALLGSDGYGQARLAVLLFSQQRKDGIAPIVLKKSALGADHIWQRFGRPQ